MKFKDVYIDEKGVFTRVFKEEYPTEYKTIFGNTPPESIDIHSVILYGERELMKAITPSNLDTVISTVILMNKEVWVKQATVINDEYDVIKPFVSERIETGKATRDEDVNNDIINSKKYFNDDEFTDGQKETAQTQQGWQENKESTYTQRGYGGTRLISEIIQKELELRQINIIKKVMLSLVKEVTLDIY